MNNDQSNNEPLVKDQAHLIYLEGGKVIVSSLIFDNEMKQKIKDFIDSLMKP